MKGIFLYHLDRKQEALDCIKQGLKNNLKSPVSWNIYGLVNRYEKNLAEAAKCYRTASKFDTENIQMLRDLATIQAQLSSFASLVETRLAMVRLAPTNRTFWIALSVAYYLNGEVENALQVVDKFESSIDEDTLDNLTVVKELNQISEFKLLLYQELRKFQQALEYLGIVRFNSERLKKYAGKFQLLLGNHVESNKIYFELLTEYNGNCLEYLDGWMASLGDQSRISEKLHGLLFLIPTSALIRSKYLLLSMCDDNFKQILTEMLSKFIKKQVSSLFSTVKDWLLCKDCVDFEEKCKFIIEYLTKNCSQDFTSNLFLSLFYLEKKSFAEAGQYLNAALDASIQSERKQVDCWVIMAKMYRKQNDLENAIIWMRKATHAFPADRYLNSKLAKYLLLSCQIEEALETMRLFLKDAKLENLSEFMEMQPIWFCYLMAKAYQQKKMRNDALKYSCQLLDYYDEMHYDQFDFHWYCIRKMTICQYLDLIRISAGMFKSTEYIKAVQLAADSFLMSKPSTDENEEEKVLEKLEKLSIDET